MVRLCSSERIDYQLDVLGIDLGELSASQHHPRCVIKNYTDPDISPTPFMPVDMPGGQTMLSSISDPLPALLFFGSSLFQVGMIGSKNPPECQTSLSGLDAYLSRLLIS